METNNVLNINNTVAGSDTTLSANVVTGIAETAPYNAGGTLATNCITTSPFIGGFTTISSYAANLTVKPAVNGYVVEYAYATYIAKTEKDLNKLIVQLLNPNKGKKNGKKA